MIHALRKLTLIASLILTAVVAVSAQRGRWERPYDAGRRAVEILPE